MLYTITTLHKNKIIRQFIAVALLLLFMVSNSPKQWLHDIFANHIDCKKATFTDNGNEQVKQLRFHCQCDHLVVENPFTAAASPISILVPFFYGHYISTDYHFAKSKHQPLPALRGPPQFIL